MSSYEICLTPQAEENPAETIEYLIAAVNEISKATEADFETVKKKKWYKRLWEVITFSKDNQKIQARGVANLAKLSEIIMKAVLLVSKQGADTAERLRQAIEQIYGNAENIEKLTGFQKKNVEIFKEIKWGYKKRLSFADLDSEKRRVFSAVFSTYVNSLDDLERNKWSKEVYKLVFDFDAQTNVKYEIVDSFNDEETVLLYRLIQSYYYLLTYQFDETSEVLDYLRISRKDEREVKEEIQFVIKNLGEDYYVESLTQGIAECFVDDEAMDWEDVSEEASEESASAQPSVEENEAESNNPEQREDITLASITTVQEGETLEFRNKNISFESTINCKGTIIFENCKITYNVSKGASSVKKSEIVMGESAKVIAKNCTFVCEGKTEKYFINVNSRKNIVSFDKCEFFGCSYFVGECLKEFYLNDSKLINCSENFAHLYFYNNDEKCCVTNNEITNEKFSAETANEIINKYWVNPLYLNTKRIKHNFDLFYLRQSDDVNMEFTISNNTVVQRSGYREILDRDVKVTYFNVENGTVSNCTFVGADICVLEAITIEDCVFKNCFDPVFTGICSRYRANVKNCFFKNCLNSIKVQSDTTISSCKFLDCKGTLINGYSAWDGGVKVEFCEFLNHTNSKDSQYENSIRFTRSKSSKSSSNEIKNCVFDGCVLGTNYLVGADCSEKPYGTVVFVSDCEFRNCKSKRNDGVIVKKNDYYSGVFSSTNTYTAVFVQDCTGLGNVNKEGYMCDNTVKEAAISFADTIGATVNE